MRWTIALITLITLQAMALATVMYARASDRKRRTCWSRWAHARGWRWCEARSGPILLGSCHAEGDVDGVAMRLELASYRTGNRPVLHTRLTAAGPARTGAVFMVHPRWSTVLMRLFGERSVVGDDGAFATHYSVFGADGVATRTALDDRARAQILEFGSGLTLDARADAVHLHWRGPELDPTRLDRAVAILTSLVAQAGRQRAAA